MKRFGIFLCVLFTAFSVHLYAANDQVTLEQNLTNLAQKTLDAMFGEGNFIVRVKVDMTTPKYSVKYTNQSNPKLNKSKKKEEEVYILPGVPALKNISPSNLKQLPYDSVTSVSQSQLKRMNVYMLVNKSFSRSQARKSQPVLKEILGFKEGRDTLKVVYKPFYFNPSTATQNITIIPGQEKLISIQNIFYLVMAVLAFLFLILYMYYQNKYGRLKGSGGSGAAPNVSVNPNLELPKGAGGSGEKNELSLSAMPKIKRFFDFIQDENVDDFIYLIKKEKLSSDYIAMMVSFLSPEIGAKVLEALPIEEKAVVAAGIVDQRLGNRQLLEKLETRIKTAMESFVGGDKRFQNVFENISQTDKKAVLTTLKKMNPEGFKKVRRNLVVFDDIKRLEADELKLILSDANVDLVAQALVSVDQDLYQKLYENLTKNARNMVAQYLELKSNSTSKKDIEHAQNYILKIALALDESGHIDLRSKLGGAK